MNHSKPDAAPVGSRDDVPENTDIHSVPWVGLGYLVFVWLPLLFAPQVPSRTLLASLLAMACFLPLYLGLFRGGRVWRTFATFAAAAVGYALIPLNPGGNTFLIYAIGMAAHAFAPARAIVFAALTLAGMALQAQLLGGQQFRWAFFALTVAIGLMVLAGTLYSRARERRNAELRLSREEVKRLARLAERERIGRDLHDLLGHTLSLVAIKSELAGKLLERDPHAAREQIREVERVAREALAQVRQAVSGIRAAGLEAELAASRLALLSAEVHMDQRLAPVALAAEVESALALALREAVTNVLRHARAARVEVELHADGSHAELLIVDDGRGGADDSGHGLAGMRERLAAVGGTLVIDSPPGAGTRLRLRVPRLPDAPAAQPVAAPRLSQ